MYKYTLYNSQLISQDTDLFQVPVIPSIIAFCMVTWDGYLYP